MEYGGADGFYLLPFISHFQFPVCLGCRDREFVLCGLHGQLEVVNVLLQCADDFRVIRPARF